MNKIITLLALFMLIIYSARFIARVCGALAKAMSINESGKAMTSQEELK